MKKGDDLRILPFDQLPDWDDFVESHIQGTLFHTCAMIRTMESAKGHSPFAHAAVDENGAICAMLVAVKVSTLGRWADRIAARSIAELSRFYSVVSESYAGSKVPLADRSLFKAAFREMPQNICRVFLPNTRGESPLPPVSLPIRIAWFIGMLERNAFKVSRLCP